MKQIERSKPAVVSGLVPDIVIHAAEEFRVMTVEMSALSRGENSATDKGRSQIVARNRTMAGDPEGGKDKQNQANQLFA